MKDMRAGRGGAVLCVGRVYADLVFTGLPRPPAPGTEVFAESASLHPGGGAAITAAWLAALGRPACLAAVLPSAPFDIPVRAALGDHGVDLAACIPATGSEPQVTVAMVRPDGERAFVTRAPGAAIPPALDFTGVAHLHVGELRTLREHPDLIARTRAAGATLSCDCGWEDEIDPECGALLSQLDLFLPNADEAAHLASVGLPDAPAPLTVVKHGAGGAEARIGGTRLRRPAPRVRVVDTTGAGDAFAAGFLNHWLDGAPVAAALEAGIVCGARCVTAPGGMPALTRVPETVGLVRSTASSRTPSRRRVRPIRSLRPMR